ncbi:MAG TPA: cell division protein FtsQ [Oscillatoriales bacterium UBA8482]|nr:MAG: cell division protein FtsQ [Oscillatoriales cyanobacterium CG2_30_40_61]HBW56568.1 cell division protein FtsQ [Oscillatoriales bacterium UBA8482]
MGNLTQIKSLSTHQLRRQRQQLRRQRRLRLVQMLWQTLALGSLTGGMFWLINQPLWLISQPEQVKVEGNQLLSDQMVRSLLPLSYPQSLWKIQPQVLASGLESRGQIASAHVTRQLFPPSLTVNIQERKPVAIAYPAGARALRGENHTVGWLDATGDWMPLENYQELEKSQQLPSLKVMGNFNQYRSYWPQVYQAIGRSPVQISEINWEDPNNLILETEIGTVHLGPYTSKFPEQLQVIDRMRNIRPQLDRTQMMYFDLKNPQQPLLQIPAASTDKSRLSQEESGSN